MAFSNRCLIICAMWGNFGSLGSSKHMRPQGSMRGESSSTLPSFIGE
jgi:hypothetical protein